LAASESDESNISMRAILGKILTVSTEFD
jgi:hypothetical protein